MPMRIADIKDHNLPLVSIIIPIYKVSPFVRKTLQSVAAQTYPNIETIIVNDATPDDSMTVVRRSLTGVPTPHIIQLEQNGGLGNARNVGMQQAAGEYIFFLDSDDWLAPDAIAKAVSKAQLGDAQVVVIDFYKANHDRLTRAKDRTPYRGAKFDVFDPRDEQSVLLIFNLAQIKLYKRSFLEAHNFQFKSGVIYEDIDWTFKIMMTARRVAIVNEPLYYYRVNRPGSILSTKGEKHFDVLDQYEDVFTFLHENGHENFLKTVYSYALNALYSVLFVASRIPPARERDFFLRAHKILKTARGNHDFKVTLYNRGKVDRYFLQKQFTPLAMRRTQWFKTTSQFYRNQVQFLRRQKDRLIATKKKYKWEIAKVLRDQHVKHPNLYDRILGPVPRPDVMFESYWGQQFADSPKYLYTYLKEHHPDVRCAFALKTDVDADIETNDRIRWKSHAYRVALKHAKVMINNNNFSPDTTKRDDQLFIQTFHGIPLKKIGTDIIGYPDAGRQNWWALVRRCQMWDYVVTAGAHHTETLRGAFQTNATFLEIGSPRTDCLQSQTEKEKWRAHIRAHFGLAPDTRLVLYAPTWRKSTKPVLLGEPELATLLAAVPEDVCVLYRSHHMAKLVDLDHPRIFNASNYPDGQHLCAACDLLITDYSSMAFDFATTGAPAFFYVPDYDTYDAARGLYVDMLTEMTRLTFQNLDSLIAACVEVLSDHRQAASCNAELQLKFLEAEGPNSCQHLVDQYILPHLRGEIVEDTV